jgi:hypothetical protein
LARRTGDTQAVAHPADITSVNSFGPVRANLISKGLIFAPEHGIVAFTVPGMADFRQRQPNP